ncbi:MAG: helix-turn-helix domain-containing protein [Candidatus Hodarchaeales archaeon]|jgi:predicted transcriptional regulator
MTKTGSRSFKALSTNNNGRDQSEEGLHPFCQQISKYASQRLNERDITSDPVEEIRLLFEELRTRSDLAQEGYTFDVDLPRTIFHTLKIQPWMYTDIAGFWILRDSGIPILSLNWHQQIDHFQMTGFFGAVSSFAEALGLDLHEILLEGMRILFLRDTEQGLIFSMTVPASSMPTSQGLSILAEVRKAFVSRYQNYFLAKKAKDDIIYPETFKDFSNYVIDVIVRSEFEIYLKAGVLRTENPLLFQLTRKIMSCKKNDLFVLKVLEKNKNDALSVQKISKITAMAESKVRKSLRILEELGVIRSLRDGRGKKYISDIHRFLLATAVDRNIHRLMEATIQELMQLIDNQLAKAIQE